MPKKKNTRNTARIRSEDFDTHIESEDFEKMLKDSWIAIKLFIPTALICVFLSIKETFFQPSNVVDKSNIQIYLIFCIYIIFFTVLYDRERSKRPKKI